MLTYLLAFLNKENLLLVAANKGLGSVHIKFPNYMGKSIKIKIVTAVRADKSRYAHWEEHKKRDLMILIMPILGITRQDRHIGESYLLLLNIRAQCAYMEYHTQNWKGRHKLGQNWNTKISLSVLQEIMS